MYNNEPVTLFISIVGVNEPDTFCLVYVNLVETCKFGVFGVFRLVDFDDILTEVIGVRGVWTFDDETGATFVDVDGILIID